MVFNVHLLLLFIVFKPTDAVELAKCSKTNISPTVGFCAGKIYNFAICTGDYQKFQYTQSTLAAWISSKSLYLAQFSASTCPVSVFCNHYLPGTTVRIC